MSLIALLSNRVKNTELKEDWVRFVKDHIEEIKARATIIDISPSLMNVVRYNLSRFLREQRIDTRHDWIVYLINEFNSDVDFIHRAQVLVPSPDHLESLAGLYASSNRVIKK